MKKIIGILALLLLVGSIATITETKDVSAVWITGRTAETVEKEEPEVEEVDENPEAYLDTPRQEKYISRNNLGIRYGLKRLPDGTRLGNKRVNSRNSIIVLFPKGFKF